MVNKIDSRSQNTAPQRKSVQEGKNEPRIQGISKAIPTITITDLNGNTAKWEEKQVSPTYQPEDSLPEHLREEGL